MRSLLNILHISLFSLVFCISVFSFAPLKAQVHDKDILQDVERLFDKQCKMRAFVAHFTQKKNLKSADILLKSEGLLKVSLERIEWTILKPAYLSVIIEKDKISINSYDLSDPKQKKLKSEVYTKDQMGAKNFAYIDDLFSILKMDKEAIKKNYIIKEFSSSKSFLKITPNIHSNISSLELKLGKDKLLKTVKIEEMSGDFIEIEFSNYKKN